MVTLLAFLASFFHKTGSCRHTLIYASYTGLFTVLVEPYSTGVAKTTMLFDVGDITGVTVIHCVYM